MPLLLTWINKHNATFTLLQWSREEPLKASILSSANKLISEMYTTLGDSVLPAYSYHTAYSTKAYKDYSPFTVFLIFVTAQHNFDSVEAMTPYSNLALFHHHLQSCKNSKCSIFIAVTFSHAWGKRWRKLEHQDNNIHTVVSWSSVLQQQTVW
jgi:uncharacterized integral membrane protein